MSGNTCAHWRGTHGAADDVVLVRVPTDVPHARVVARQSGDHGARQDVVNWTDAQNDSKPLRHLCRISRPCSIEFVTLTDDFAGGAARVDEPLSGGELGGEAAADEGVQDAVAAVRHHRGVAGQLVSLQG